MSRIFKRGGVYYGDYYVVGPDGKQERQRPSLRTTSQRVALAKLRKLERIAADPAPHQTAPRLDKAVKHYVDVACAHLAEGTRKSYRSKAGHVQRVLGQATLLSELDKPAIAAYVATRLDDGAAHYTVHKELMVIRGTLKAFDYSPAIVPTIETRYTPRETWLTRAQFDKLLGALETTHAKLGAELVWQRQAWCALHVLASTNKSEAERLVWDDVHIGEDDWLYDDEGEITAKGWVRIRGTKRQARDRVVPLADEIIELLERAPRPAGRVVGPWRNSTRDLERFCAAAKIPRATSNDLRRTFASWLAQAGVPLLDVSRLMGHHSTKMVERVYAQLGIDNYTAAIAKLPRPGLRRVK